MPTRVIAGQAALEAFCRRYRIRRLSLFGFTLKRTARLDCGMDLWAEVEPGATPGPLTMAHIEIARPNGSAPKGRSTHRPRPEPEFPRRRGPHHGGAMRRLTTSPASSR